MANQPDEFEMCAVIAKSGLFDISYYLENNQDVRISGMDPILHYVRFGEKEKRKPAPFFNFEEYNPACTTGNLLYNNIISGGYKSREIIPVAFCVNKRFLPYLSVALASLIANSSPDYQYKIYIYLA